MAAEPHRTPPAGWSGPPQSWPARFFGVVADPRTYLDLAYLILSFPIGLVAFVVLVTGLSTGAFLAITLVGLPLLVLLMYGWCAYADADRLLTNHLLGTRIPRLPFDDGPGRFTSWARIKRRIASPYTWRSLFYLFLRFPHGVFTLTVTAVLVATPIGAMGLPIYYRYGDGTYFGPNYRIDTLGEAFLFAIPAPLVLIAGLHLVRLIARGSGYGTTALLGGPLTPRGERVAPEAAGDAMDVFTWRGLSFTSHLDPATRRLQAGQLTTFRVHVAISGAFMALMVAINVAAGGGHPWAIWPIWGFAIPLAIHAGYLWRGLIGAHAGLFAIVNSGLLVIDLNYGASTWFQWPLLAWGLILAFCAIGSARIRSRTIYAPEPVFDSALPLEAPRAPMPPITIDVEMRRVTVEGAVVELTPKEFDVLVLLYANPGRPFNRSELLDRIWENDYEVTERTVDACIVRLRRKLGRRAEAIQTVWGVGYKFQPSPGADPPG